MATPVTGIGSLGTQYRLELYLEQVGQDIPGNSSAVYWSLLVRKLSGSGYMSATPRTWYATIGGIPYTGSVTYDFEDYTTLLLGTAAPAFGHAPDGTQTVVGYASFDGGNAPALGAGDVTATLILDRIPRGGRARWGSVWRWTIWRVRHLGAWRYARVRTRVGGVWKDGI